MTRIIAIALGLVLLSTSTALATPIARVTITPSLVVAGKTVTLSNSGMIHYDTQLKNIWPDIWSLIP